MDGQMTPLRRSAAAAARWWTERLREGKGHALIRQLVTDDQAAGFESVLVDVIMAAHDVGRTVYRDPDGHPDLPLRTDYRPDDLLGIALSFVGIRSEGVLPDKTVMRVSVARVVVAHGYCAPFVEIHRNPEVLPIRGRAATEGDDPCQ